MLAQKYVVASFAEAWIEKDLYLDNVDYCASPPSRRRGLKNKAITKGAIATSVASFAEAWIENLYVVAPFSMLSVASFAEAWIENTMLNIFCLSFCVASFAEAWIEK